MLVMFQIIMISLQLERQREARKLKLAEKGYTNTVVEGEESDDEGYE